MPISSSSGAVRLSSPTSTGVCALDSDCDDGDACTNDVCVSSVCTFPPITGCVSCSPTLSCPPIDLVFIMDTSGSMRDEGAALCANIDQILADLTSQRLSAEISVLGITETPADGFGCLSDSVSSLLCSSSPCHVSSCPFPGNPSSFESWGPATAIVADRFGWRPGARRMIVPMGDEGPCNGDQPDGCNDPGSDRDSIEDAVAMSVQHDVVVSPITGTGAGACSRTLAEALAAGTGGVAVHMSDAGAEIADAIVRVTLGLCAADVACDDQNPCTSDDVCVGGVCAGTGVPGCEFCSTSSDCDDQDFCTNDSCVGSQCVHVSNYDEASECCTPDTGDLALIDDSDPCTDDSCDAETGQVIYAPAAAGVACDDGLFCNGSDTCANGTCSVHLGDPCTVGTECADQCDELTQSCSDAAGTPCTDDGNPCTDNECDGSGSCVFVNHTRACDDGVFCTVGESCMNGVCAGGSPRDCSAMDSQCGIGVCIGELGMCNAKPRQTGVACDDGDACTADDVCDGNGGCFGTRLDIPACHAEPTLCLEANRACLELNQEVIVNVVLGPSIQVVAGGSFAVGFDPALFQVVDVYTGHTVDVSSPYRVEAARIIDNAQGTVFYAVGILPGGSGSPGPAIMASIRMRVVSSCRTSEPLCFLSGNIMSTTLTDMTGTPVPYVPCCSSALAIGGDPVLISCPHDVFTNADAGGVTAEVTWAAPDFSGGCPGPVQSLVCSASNDHGAAVTPLISQGGTLPSGVTAFQCEVTDACGVASACSWNVEVRRLNPIETHLQLSPVIQTSALLRRCIEFALYASCVESPALVEEVVEFGGPFNLPGHADHVVFKVPAGRYECITARDPLHTLRSSSPLSIVDGRYVADFRGDPFFGGNWLVGGNLNGDRVIDILDFGLFIASQYLSPAGSDTMCGLRPPHADFDGNGVVNALDFGYLSLNFLEFDKDACCGVSTAGVPETGTMDISIHELNARGMGHLTVADLNQDGRLNLDDVRSLLQGRRPAPRASAKALSRSLRSSSR